MKGEGWKVKKPFTTHFSSWKTGVNGEDKAFDFTFHFSPFTFHVLNGGGERDRTDDPLRARQVLSQLSYTPINQIKIKGKIKKGFAAPLSWSATARLA